MKVEFVRAEVLTVGPDEALIIHFPEEFDEVQQNHLFAALKEAGLEKRSVVFVGDVRLAKAQRDPD